MKSSVLAFLTASFLLAGAAAIQAQQPAPTNGVSNANAPDQQQKPKKHHRHKGKHHKKQPQKTQPAGEQNSQK
jgi:TolA-binding protein